MSTHLAPEAITEPPPRVGAHRVRTIDAPEAMHPTTPMEGSPQGRSLDHAPEANPAATTRTGPPRVHGSLAEATLRILAENHSAFERTRIETENRLRSMHQVYNVPEGVDLPEIVRLHASVDACKALEHQAELDLKRALRVHPLGPWVKRTIGIGEKQGARLIAAIGDPYWNSLHDRPRTVSELWAYCGYHVLTLGQHPSDTHRSSAEGQSLHPSQGTHDAQGSRAGVEPSSDSGHIIGGNHVLAAGVADSSNPGQLSRDAQLHPAGVAPSRRKGQKANWNTDAKMRAFLCAESCIKQAASPYRAVYDAARYKYAEATHPAECKRCGPSGKPAAAGSPLSAGHQHARALRLVAKTILRDLWIEARDA